MKQRMKEVGIFSAEVIAMGSAYAVFVGFTGLAVPCAFHRMTGFKCPGCGVTTMCLAIMHGDFEMAFLSNQMLFILLPVLTLLLGSYTLRYVKTGSWSMSKGQTAVAYICIGLLILFAVYRNIHMR